MKTKVLARMKPKTASLGFNEKELEGVAATLAGNLKEDATEEQIDAEIEKILPLLKVSQSAVNRIVNAEKEKLIPPTPAPAPAAGTNPVPQQGANNQQTQTPPAGEGEPAWFKAYREEQERKYRELTEAKTKETRRVTFEAMLKDLRPKQKEAMLKDFDRISFKDDADFEAYKAEKQVSIDEIVQELANEGLSKLTPPQGGGSTKTEVDEFVNELKKMNEPVKTT